MRVDHKRAPLAVLAIGCAAVALMLFSSVAPLADQVTPTSGGPLSVKVTFTYGLFFPNMTSAASELAALGPGFTPSCQTGCNGIWFYSDPSPQVVNEGLTNMRDRLWNFSGAISNRAVFLGVSNGTTSFVQGDNPTTGPCKTTSGLSTTGPVVQYGQVVLAHNTFNSKQTGNYNWALERSTIVLTAAHKLEAVQVACYLFGNPTVAVWQFAEASFTQVTLLTTNQINMTWVVNMTQG